MKFYEGELRSNGRPATKWEIRKYFHSQLSELWKIDPALAQVRKYRRIPRGGYMMIEQHHSMNEVPVAPVNGDAVDLLEPIVRGGREFLPLIRNSLGLRCGLKIAFMRKEEPGRLYQGGDMDNRLKTLFDALSVPNPDQIIEDSSVADPIYCLLEDDGLISQLDVDTHRLLTKPNSSKHEVHLLIEVDVRVAHARQYNQPFLDD